jgi:hypothetical protein
MSQADNREKWINWIINGGEMPTIELPKVPDVKL